MNELERRIYVDSEIVLYEYDYLYGNKKDVPVVFQYYNWKKDKEGNTIERFNYKEALDFARYRSNDRRYKNYEFLISK